MAKKKSREEYSDAYWQSEREFFLKYPRELGTDDDKKKFEHYLAKKRGLLNSSWMLAPDSLKLIACGLTEAGLEKAGMAAQFAEAALEVGDLVYGHEPIESGKHRAYRSLAMAKWVRGEPGWEPLLAESADWWCRYLNAPKKYDAFLRKWHMWQAVIPFLLVGDIARAEHEYQLAYANEWPDPAKLGLNARHVGKVFGVVVGYLAGNAELADAARETFARFRLSASRWGDKEGLKMSPMWEKMFIDHHVLLAWAWAKYFGDETDPVRIVESVR